MAKELPIPTEEEDGWAPKPISVFWGRDKSPATAAIWTSHSVFILNTILTTLALLSCYTYTHQLGNGNVMTKFSYGEGDSCNENKW